MRRLANAVRRLLGRRRARQPIGRHPDFPELEERQLAMSIAGSAARQCQLPEIPSGYCIRSFEPGDEDSWIDLIAKEFGRWERERFDAYLAEPERRQRLRHDLPSVVLQHHPPRRERQSGRQRCPRDGGRGP